MIEMQGMSMIETNLKLKKEAAAAEAGIVPAEEEEMGAGGGSRKRKDLNILGLADESDEGEQVMYNIKPIKGAGDWMPKLRKTDCVGTPSVTPGRTF